MGDLRELRFSDLTAASREAESLLNCGYERHGNWTLAQVCRHLRLVQDSSVDGYPRWMALFAPLRPVMRRLLLPRIMSGDSPTGIPTTPIYAPPGQLDDTEEVAKFAESVHRFYAHAGPYEPHPAFGRMDRDSLEDIHAAHAAHHLRFLTPRAKS